MKKRIIVVCVCLMLIASLLLVACEGANVCKIESIEGIGDAKIDNDARTVTLNVAPEVLAFDLAVIKAPKEIKIEAFTDKECANAIVGNVVLKDGLNIFFVRLSATEKKKTVSVTYEFKVTRLASAIPEHKLTEIKLNDWKAFYNVNEAFVTSKLSLIYADKTNELIDITVDMLTGFDTATVGTREVTVTYGGLTVKGNITVGDSDEIIVDNVTPTVISQDVAIEFLANIMETWSSLNDYVQPHGIVVAEIKNDASLSKNVNTMREGAQKAGITETQLLAISNSVKTILTNIGVISGQDYAGMEEIADAVIQLFVKNDSTIASWRDEISAIIDSFSETQLGLLIKSGCQLVDEIAMREYTDAIEKLDVNNVNNTPETKEAINRQIDMYRNDINTYQLEDTHYVMIARRIKGAISAVTQCDTVALGKLANTVLRVYEAISNGYGLEAVGALFNTPGTSLSEAANHLHEIGALLEKVASSWGRDTFGKLIETAGMPQLNNSNGVLSVAMAIGENSADGINAIAKMLKSVTAEDLTTIYADLDDALKEIQVVDGKANPLYTQKTAVLVLRVQQFLMKNVNTWSFSEINSIKYIVEAVGGLFLGNGKAIADNISALLFELNKYTITEVSNNFAKAKELMDKLPTMLGYSTKDYISVNLDTPIFNDVYDTTIDVKKGATPQEVVDIINANCTIMYYQHDGIAYLGTPISASVDNLVADTSKAGFVTFSISMKRGEVMTTEPFKAYVYDENSYKDYTVLNTNAETMSIYSCAINAEPTYPITAAYKGAYYVVDEVAMSINDILGEQESNCVCVGFSLADYTNKKVRMIYDTKTPGLKTGYLIQADPILGNVILPFDYFVEYPSGTTGEAIITDLMNRSMFAINVTPAEGDYGEISYTRDGGVTATQTYSIKQADITGLDLTTAGEQKITITATELGKTVTTYVYVLSFDESKQIEMMSTTLEPRYIKDAEVELTYSIGFIYPAYNVARRNLADWNTYFKTMNFGYVMELKGFDTSTVGVRFATVSVKDASGNIVFSLEEEYEIYASATDISSFSVTIKDVFAESELTQEFILANIKVGTTLYDLSYVPYNTAAAVKQLFTAQNATIKIDKHAGYATLTFTMGNNTYSQSVKVIKDSEKALITSVDDLQLMPGENVIVQGTDWAAGSLSTFVNYGYGYDMLYIGVGDPNVTITGFDKNKVGLQNIIISYYGFEKIVQIEVTAAL